MSSEIIETLNSSLHKVIIIKLRNKKTIQGNLRDFDQGMNLILTNSKDITYNDTKILDTIIIRGDNIVMVSLPGRETSLNLKDDASI